METLWYIVYNVSAVIGLIVLVAAITLFFIHTSEYFRNEHEFILKVFGFGYGHAKSEAAQEVIQKMSAGFWTKRYFITPTWFNLIIFNFGVADPDDNRRWFMVFRGM